MDFETVRKAWLDMKAGMDPDQARFLDGAFHAIVRGAPVPLDEARRELGLPPARFDEALHSLLDAGLLTLDASGRRIDGAKGLSLAPSRHTLFLGERRFFTWCALDAVGIPAALGADARVASATEDDSGPVAIRFERGRPRDMAPQDLRISIPPPGLDASFVDETCATIHFRRAGPAPEVVALFTVEEAAALGRELWAEARG